MDRQTAIVTGASSGLGEATVARLAKAGHRVFAVVRSPESADPLLKRGREEGFDVELLLADVRDSEAVTAAFSGVLELTGRVDLLVNSAGIAATGVLEDTTPERYLELMDVNLCGTVRCIQAVLPTMRSQGEGCIVNVSSNAGRVAVLAQSAYVASKWALEGVSEGLAQELVAFGIRVVIVEPGVTRSAIFGKDSGPPARGGPYDAHYRRMLRYYKRAVPLASDPDVVAETIEQAWLGDGHRLRHACSWGGSALIRGREAMSDEEWVDMGVDPDDELYYLRFKTHFGLDLG